MRAAREPSVEQQIEQLAAELAPSPGERLTPRTLLAEVGFDSLAWADLALAVEERFGIRLGDTDVEEFRTLADVARAVSSRPDRRLGLPRGIGRSVTGAKGVAGPVLRWWFHMRIAGTEHIPAEGPVVVAANHRSMWDIPILVVAFPRRVVFMAKRELYRNAFLNRLWLELGGFPVRRGGADLRAIDNALEVLDRGLALGIYPEGTRSFTGEMLPFLKGAAWLAVKTGASIVPCAITGSARRARNGRGGRRGSTMRRPVTLTFGPPIPVEVEADPIRRRAEAEAVTARLLESIISLLG